MNWKCILLTGWMFLLTTALCFAQKDWSLKEDKEGIKIYTKNLENSPYKGIKTVCIIDASLTRLTAVLLDISRSADWVYATKKCTLLKKQSPSELLYYSEVEVPWPVSNRDFIVLLKVTQDEKTKAVTVEGINRPTYLPENKHLVRIQECYSKWVIIPLANGQVKVEYVLEVNPGGNIPSWLINLFAAKGPYESFRNLRKEVRKNIYAQVNLPFIKN